MIRIGQIWKSKLTGIKYIVEEIQPNGLVKMISEIGVVMTFANTVFNEYLVYQSFVSDDENLKDLRKLADHFGVTQLIKDSLESPAMMGFGDIERLVKAYEILTGTNPDTTRDED